MRSTRRSRLRDKVRRLFNTTSECPARFVGRVPMPGTPLRPADIESATIPLPAGRVQVVRQRGYRALREPTRGVWTGIQPGPQDRGTSPQVAL